MTALNGQRPAELLRDFFSLQLQFAEVVAARRGRSLGETLTFCTNLHRRFAYGNLARQAPDAGFTAFADHLAHLHRHAERLDAIVLAFAARPVLGAPANTAEFGCFRCEPPNARGHVRIHFVNNDSSADVGPLHRSKVMRRRAELAEMVCFLAREYPESRAIDGGSWLYNTEAYRRLFPAEFVASRKPPPAPRLLHGGSTWGQFLDFRARVKPVMRDAFLARLHDPSFDPERAWDAFPYPVLKTSAAFHVFQREFQPLRTQNQRR